MPLKFCEARAHPDANVWHTAMQHELDTLCDQGVFQPQCYLLVTKLSVLDGSMCTSYILMDIHIICGKEKAQLVTQGFSQQPEDFSETYTPVAKRTSI